MDESNKLTVLRRDIVKGNNSVPVDTPTHFNDNDSDGGEPPMAKYVTHEELELSNQKILREMDKQFNSLDKKLDKMSANTDIKSEQINTKFEQVNTKFEKQKVWFFTTGISIVVASCTIIGFLIKFFK